MFISFSTLFDALPVSDIIALTCIAPPNKVLETTNVRSIPAGGVIVVQPIPKVARSACVTDWPLVHEPTNVVN